MSERDARREFLALMTELQEKIEVNKQTGRSCKFIKDHWEQFEELSCTHPFANN